MSYSNKIFNVNGLGRKDLLNTIKLAASDALICGYLIRNEEGLRIYLSQSLLPDEAIVYETPKSIDDDISVIENYLEKIKDTIVYSGNDARDEKISVSGRNTYKLGWRVFIDLSKQSDIIWWDHSIIVRPSYVTI